MPLNQFDQSFWAAPWTLRDVLALVVTAIVLGCVFFLWGWAMHLLNQVLGEVLTGVLYGIWLWAGLLLAYAIRKPGAALLGEFSAALLAFVLGNLLGSPMGVLILVCGWVQGLGLEVVFAWGRFQSWGWLTMAMAGALAGTASFAVTLAVDHGVSLAVELAASRGVQLMDAPWHIFPYSGGMIFIILCIAVISGAVLGGIICKVLGDRLLAVPQVRQFLGATVA
jgi:energy-coupling factor transport system substrate-specific component